jgi:sugar-specific transcriptional regulator TrmB
VETVDVLEKLGLNEKQASVYLALLELGTASVYGIAQKAEIKRPTTYFVLDELKQMGLVNIIPRAKKTLYSAESPELLRMDLNKKEELLNRSLPQLLAIYNKKKEKPQVQWFQGKEGVRQIYKKIYASGNVDFFGTVQEVVKIDPEDLKEFVKTVKEKQLVVRELLSHTEADKEYAGTVMGQTHQTRFLPNEQIFLADSAIFGDNVVFFSFNPQIFAVMITSKEIAQSVKILFELAWSVAQPSRKQRF